MTTTTHTAPTDIKLTKALQNALTVLTAGPAAVSNSTDTARQKIYWQSAEKLIELGYAQQDGPGQPLLITHMGRAALAMANGEPAPNPDDAAGTLDLPGASGGYTAAVDEHPADAALAAPAQYVEHIPLDLLHEVEHNREKGDLEGLAASIRIRGVRQPIEVRPRAEGGYEIVDGARRVAASRLAGKTTVPSLIDPEIGDVQAELDRILLNVQRLDPSPLEEAAAYERLTKAPFKMTATQVADAVGRSESHVSKRRSLLVLPDPARDALVDGRINIQTALGMTALAKDKERLDAAVKDIPSTKASNGDLEWQRQRLDRTIARNLEELNRERELDAKVKELEAAGETVIPWQEWIDDGNADEPKWREVDDDEEHEAVTIPAHGAVRVLKITTQPEATADDEAAATPAGKHKPPKPEGDIGFVEQQRRKKQQELDEIARPRRQIVANLLTGAGDDDILARYIADEVAATLIDDDMEVVFYDRRTALELLGLGEDVARDYMIDRQTFAEYAGRTTLTKLRATVAAIMATPESMLVSVGEKRDPGVWAPVADDDYSDDATQVRRYLAFLERHGYELHPTEVAAITPVETDDQVNG